MRSLGPRELVSTSLHAGSQLQITMDLKNDHLRDAGRIETAHAEKTYDDDDDRAPEARGRNADEFEKNYWRSWRFIGSMRAIDLGFCGGTGGYAREISNKSATELQELMNRSDRSFAPTDRRRLLAKSNITWIGLAYLVGEAVFFLLVGRISDIFGRRWFLIIGSLIGVVGHIVGATAQTINTLIGAEVLIGISAAFQISFFWVISEILPMKWRYLANSYAYPMTIPTNPLAAKIAFTFQQTGSKWRASLESNFPWLNESLLDGLSAELSQLLLHDRRQCTVCSVLVSFLSSANIHNAAPQENGQRSSPQLRLAWLSYMHRFLNHSHHGSELGRLLVCSKLAGRIFSTLTSPRYPWRDAH